MYTCEHCGKIFTRSQGLEYHKSQKVCLKHMCLNCGCIFRSSLGLDYDTNRRVCYAKCKIPLHITKKNAYSREFVPFENISLHHVVINSHPFQRYVFEEYRLIIPRLIERVLCNPDIDEYWTHYIQNKKDIFIKVHNGETWELRTQKTEFLILYRWALQTLRDYYAKYKGFFTPEQQLAVNHLIDELNGPNKKKLQKEIFDNFFCLFLNHKVHVMKKYNSLSSQ